MAATLRRQIERYVADWRPILGLQDWNLVIHIDKRCKEEAYCEAKPCYEDAVLGFNLRFIRKAGYTPRALEALVLHEMVHCVIWKSSERAVTQIERSLLRARYPKEQLELT